MPNSADDALYTVYHKGGTTQFKVNQQMGGGTWIYLGTFGFNAGRNNECKVVLSNLSSKVGRIITADAVKIGGGMGNIARGEVPVSAKPPATGCNGQAYRTAYIQKATARMTIPTTINAVVSG